MNKRLRVVLAAVATMIAASSWSAVPIFDRQVGFLDPADTYAVDIAIATNGDIYTIDPYHKRVRVETATGELIRESFGNFALARGIAIDSQGNAYVSDSSRRIVAKFDSNGDFQEEWTGSGGIDFVRPRGVFVDADDRLWMADGGLNKIFVINGDGSLDRVWGVTSGGDGGLKSPTDVFVAASGEVYVCSSGSGVKLQRFDQTGNLIDVLVRQADFAEGLPWPSAVVVNEMGEIYLNDRANHRILKFSPEGEFMLQWGSAGAGPGQFRHSHGMAIGVGETIWVAGYHGHDLQQFDSDGNFVQRIQSHVSSDDGNADARGMGIDSQGNVFFSDGWNQRVKKYSPSGELLLMFGTRGTGDGEFFNFPKAIAIDSNDNVVVAEDDGLRLFSNNGVFQSFFGPYLLTTGARYFYEPRGLVFDSFDNLFVSDTNSHRIVKLEAGTGNVLAEWGSSGPQIGEFSSPRGIEHGSDGKLYVADYGNKRIQILDQNGNTVHSWDTTSEGNPFSIREDSDGNFLVGTFDRIVRYDPDGKLVEKWGADGSGPAQFDRVWEIAINQDGSVLASDMKNGRIQRFVYPFEGTPIGKPAYVAGSDLGYFLWQDNDDGEWHLRWSGDGIFHSYDATIEAIGGRIAGVRAYSFEASDQLTVSDNVLSITAYNSTWEDGIDFFASPGSILKHVLNIDGEFFGAPIFVGSGLDVPAAYPVFVPAESVPETETLPVFGEPGYTPGSSMGFYLWQDDAGMWHLRWNSNGAPHQFSGSILSSAAITDVVPYRFEADDQYYQDDFLLSFSGRSSVSDDGIDFQAEDGAELVFRLSVDGSQNAGDVFIGPDQLNPAADVFGLVSSPPLSMADPAGVPSFPPGSELGYFIWQDNNQVWHVRANPDGLYHGFSGTIMSTVPIEMLTPVGLEGGDVIDTDENRIEWSFGAASWYDGFKFSLAAPGRLTFETKIDEAELPSLVFIGASRTNPESMPFALE